MEPQQLLNHNKKFREKEQNLDISTPDFKIYNKALVAKITWHWHQSKQNSEQIYLSIDSWRKDISSINSIGESGCPQVEEINYTAISPQTKGINPKANI